MSVTSLQFETANPIPPTPAWYLRINAAFAAGSLDNRPTLLGKFRVVPVPSDKAHPIEVIDVAERSAIRHVPLEGPLWLAACAVWPQLAIDAERSDSRLSPAQAEVGRPRPEEIEFLPIEIPWVKAAKPISRALNDDLLSSLVSFWSAVAGIGPVLQWIEQFCGSVIAENAAPARHKRAAKKLRKRLLPRIEQANASENPLRAIDLGTSISVGSLLAELRRPYDGRQLTRIGESQLANLETQRLASTDAARELHEQIRAAYDKLMATKIRANGPTRVRRRLAEESEARFGKKVSYSTILRATT